MYYTVFQKSKPRDVSLIITLANVDRLSKSFHQVIRKKILYVMYISHRFPPHLQYVATFRHNLKLHLFNHLPN